MVTKRRRLDDCDTMAAEDVTVTPVAGEVGELQIDAERMSRDIRHVYVVGAEAMKRMANSHVFLHGLGGLGVEIAKNITLTGVRSLTLCDDKAATWMDLSSQFFLNEDDVGKGTNRAVASQPHLEQLNPYVRIKQSPQALTADGNLDFLKAYDCVVLTECSLEVQLAVNAFCRSQEPQIKFVAADVHGVFCSTFCDFGDAFDVHDTTGEEPKEFFISNVTQASPGVVTTLENRKHDLQDDDEVRFTEVEGMTELNGEDKVFTVSVISPTEFSVGDTSSFSSYTGRGLVSQLPRKSTLKFEPLEAQLSNPTILPADFAKLDNPNQLHLALRTAHAYRGKNGALPGVWNAADADAFVALAKELNAAASSPLEAVDEALLRTFAFTCRGQLCGLTAFLGGWVAQDVLKAVSGKFTPLQQWLFLDAVEVVPDLDTPQDQFAATGSRVDGLRCCVGSAASDALAGMKLFMIGCGAIGCEMLKNYALLGIGTTDEGGITITDNDIIEKSNLNRQFLFRPEHIQCPKSTTGAAAAKAINPHLNINALQLKIEPASIDTFGDEFFRQQTIVVNALDNVAARLYVDSRCVTNQKPLLESGTMGAKGHVQVIVPHLTESYGSQRDPPEKEVPYCTLKSFPATIEHTIQWAREKFGNLFELKPSEFNKFWEDNGDAETVVATLKAGDCGKSFGRTRQMVKLLGNRPFGWPDCVALARKKFEKYFNHKARHLLQAFPLDTKLKDGTPFWQPPKRPPQPVMFDPADEGHMMFITSAARLFAEGYNIPVTKEELAPEAVAAVVATVPVPVYVVKSKTIVTDETMKKEEAAKAEGADEDASLDEFPKFAAQLEDLFQAAGVKGAAPVPSLQPAVFEKDDESNGHIDFITSASNLRASMYSIQPADRHKTRKIAGKIIPAISTTTAAVAGLVTVELIKLVLDREQMKPHFKNAFLNLAIPLLVHSEPQAAERTPITADTSYTLWDRWEIQGSKSTTLQEFLDAFEAQFKLEPTGIFCGASMIYVPMMPGHSKKLTKAMRKLLKEASGAYADLTVLFETEDGTEVAGPPVRYFLRQPAATVAATPAAEATAAAAN
eukprot:m.91570 g.91570  ORF g.91570 m.91570 type:complete len:1078 (-) comp15042_c0_seq4:33-3266(-)